MLIEHESSIVLCIDRQNKWRNWSRILCHLNGIAVQSGEQKKKWLDSTRFTCRCSDNNFVYFLFSLFQPIIKYKKASKVCRWVIGIGANKRDNKERWFTDDLLNRMMVTHSTLQNSKKVFVYLKSQVVSYKFATVYIHKDSSCDSCESKKPKIECKKSQLDYGHWHYQTEKWLSKLYFYVEIKNFKRKKMLFCLY